MPDGRHVRRRRLAHVPPALTARLREPLTAAATLQEMWAAFATPVLARATEETRALSEQAFYFGVGAALELIHRALEHPDDARRHADLQRLQDEFDTFVYAKAHH